MINDFLEFQAKTGPNPIGLEIKKAKGSYIWDTSNKKYLDFIAGVSANSLGHRHPKIIKAIKDQLDLYMHVMVYGEFAQKPAIDLSKKLIQKLPKNLDVLYLTNSGTEAIEGATIQTADRPGLLVDIAKVFFKKDMSIFSSRINTLGDKVEDTFEIEGKNKAKISTTKVNGIIKALKEVV